METSTLMLIGSIVTIIGGSVGIYATYIGSQQSNKDTQELKSYGIDAGDKLKSLQALNDSLRLEIDYLKSSSTNQLKKIEDLTIQNANLALQLGNATIEIKRNITGEDGFCEILFVASDESDFRKLVVKNHSAYPQHDLVARFIDLESFEIANRSNPPPNPITGIIELSEKPIYDEFAIKLGTIMVNKEKDLKTVVQIGKYGNRSSFNIFVEGKNGDFVQLTRMIKIKNEWVTAVRIQDSTTGEKKYEYVDPRFPKDKLNFE